MAKKNEDVESSPIPRFTKGQILGSKRYRKYCDILQSILSEKETYSHDDVGKVIEKFMKGKVK